MMINKTAILPVISVICMAIYAFTGHQISTDIQEQIATGSALLAGAGISIWGIYKSHKKKGDK